MTVLQEGALMPRHPNPRRHYRYPRPVRLGLDDGAAPSDARAISGAGAGDGADSGDGAGDGGGR